MSMRRRYQPRQRPSGEWDCYDTLHNAPTMTATSEADAEKGCELLNVNEPLILTGFLSNPLAGLTQEDLVRLNHIVEQEAAAAPDKYALAGELAEYINYACDRMCTSRVLKIQLLWEALLRANGYAPCPVQGTLTPPSEPHP